MINACAKSKVTENKENYYNGCSGELASEHEEQKECAIGHPKTTAADRERCC